MHDLIKQKHILLVSLFLSLILGTFGSSSQRPIAATNEQPENSTNVTIMMESRSNAPFYENSAADSLPAVATTPLAMTTADSASSVVECYNCDIVDYEKCKENSWTSDCVTNICYVNITRSGDSVDLVSMGCAMDVSECLYYDSPDQCSMNGTTCLLCCNSTWCNSAILDNILPPGSVTDSSHSSRNNSIDITQPVTISPLSSFTARENTLEHVTSYPLPDQDTASGSPEILKASSLKAHENTLQNSEPVTTLSKIDQDATVGTEEPSRTTDSMQPSLQCYTCEFGSTANCQTNAWSLDCGTNVCYLNLTNSDSGYLVSMGCTSFQNIKECLYENSPSRCSRNETACLLCCNTTWCNSDILEQLMLTTPEPITNSPFGESEITVKTSTPSEPERQENTTEAPWVSTTLPAIELTANTRESVSITSHSSILECYECLGEYDWLCNKTASLKKCQNIEEICYWSINSTRSSFVSSKGCISKSECYALGTSNSASCGDFTTVVDQCTWCCEDESKCNHDRGNYSEISSPANPPHTEYCDMSSCLIMFQLLVAEASKEPDLFFSQFCRSVPLVFGCLSNVTSQCTACDGESTEILESILTNMTAQCPVPCDPEAGFNCTLMFYYDVVESLSHGLDCKEISEIEVSQARCRVRTVGSCDATVRESVDVTYDAISSESKAICNATYPDYLPIEGTESPNCDILVGLKCITDFGEVIIRYFLQHTDNLKQICESSSRSKQCYEEIAFVCSDIKRQSLDIAWNFTFGLISEKCTTKICDTTKGRKCIVDLMSLIEAKKDIQGACRMIPETIECVSINTEGCTSDEQESLNDTLKYTLDLIGNQCNDYVQVFANETIELCEGDDPVQISYILNSSPSLICGSNANCRIFIDIEIEIGSYPRCRNGNPIRQAVIVKSTVQGSSESLCSNEATEENWNQHQNVSIAAKLDFKYDKTQYRKMIIWYRKTINNITMERRSLRNITLVICDRDQANSICSSVNDPHIRTFDGWYYNNFLEGFFILYRHRYLPFEVQIATQRCNGQATCNCAAYVRSGDTVLAIDKCRKKSFFEKWCRRRNIGKFECSNVMKFHLYGHDRITPGTKIYSRNNGKQYFVIFPSGTQVKITVDGNYISIYITPSPIDFWNTAGLCGLFDNNATNDLVLRNGNSYKGAGFYKRGQPKDFCKDWRPVLSENIYQGVSKRPYNHELYCECDGNKESSSVNSKCNTNALLELCDVDTSGEEIRPLFEYSESQVDNDDGHMDNENKRRRRQTEANPLGDFDIEENFDPPNVPVDNITVSWATEVCQTFFDSIKVAQQCQKESVADFTTSIAGCVDDLMVTNSTLWMTTALDSLKEDCLRELSQNPVYVGDPAKAQIADEVQSASCLNQCNSHGNCTKGTCTCDAGYTGMDCGFDLTMELDYLEVYNSFCDLKRSNCSSAQITGVGFIPNITSCRVQPVMVTEKGMEMNGDSEEADLIFISPDEVHCQLNKQTSALIDVFNADFAQNSSLFIIIYDSTCYDCSAHLTMYCVKVKNSCIINGGCYGPGQENPEDKCMICRPGKSDSEWTFNSDSDSCNMNIPLIVGLCVGLGCGLIILAIIVIIIVYKVHCAGSQKLPSLDEYETLSHSSVHRSHNFAYENLFKPEQIEVAGSYCDGQFSMQKEEPCPDMTAFPKSTKESFGL